MAKLLVERPRLGGGGKLRRYRRFDPTEDGPTRQSMSRNRDGRGKILNENLAPLCRFLASNVGRPWNVVYSELREHVRIDSAIQLHILQHLWQFVERNVILVDGVPCCGEGRSYGDPLRTWRRGSAFYVHPTNGLLLPIKKVWKRKRRPKPPPPKTLPDGRQAHQINGIWYAVELADYVEGNPPVIDVVLGEQSGHDSWRTRLETYGSSYVYGIRKQQLGKREIRRLGLR
jgi:hypothetical protein